MELEMFKESSARRDGRASSGAKCRLFSVVRFSIGYSDRPRYFKGVKIPEASQPAPAPKEEDPAVQNAIAEATRARKSARGYRATILSKNMMDDQGDGTKQLLGTLGS